MLEHQFKTAGIKVEQDLHPDLPAIHGNTGKLQQVFLNLFLNAKDAMPGGGRLTISTLNGHRAQVKVSDTGSGIAQENIHAGKIRVDSVPGRGTTFTMEFPLVRKAVSA